MIRHGPKLSIRHIHVYSCIVPCVLLTLEAHSLLPCSGLFTWGPREAFRLSTSLSLLFLQGHTQIKDQSLSGVKEEQRAGQQSLGHLSQLNLARAVVTCKQAGSNLRTTATGVGPRAQKHHRLRRCRRVAKFYEHNFSRKAHECICVEGCMSVAHVLQCQLDWT